MARTSNLTEVGDRDGWRCWLCDEPVDPDRSVNDDRGPSVDARITRKKAKKKSKNTAREVPERLAHRACNTGKGNVAPVVAWPDDLFVSDPAVIITSVERLATRGGREAMGRCPTEDDAEAAGAWLLDRISRLEPGLELSLTVEPGGGQYLLVLAT
jgi:hypothetical protein